MLLYVMCTIKRLVLENMRHHSKPRPLKQREKSCDNRNKANAEICAVKTGLIVCCRVWKESRWSHLLSPVVWAVVEVCCWWGLWSRRRWGYLKQRPTTRISKAFRWTSCEVALSTLCAAAALAFVRPRDVAVILSTPCTVCHNVTQTGTWWPSSCVLNSDCAQAKLLLRSQMLACRGSDTWETRPALLCRR